MRIVSLASLLVPLLIAPVAFAAEEPPKKAPTIPQALEIARMWIDAQRAYDEVPGMSYAVVHGQKVVWSGGSGVADRQTKQPATADTIYSICSVSKLFTSLGVMQLRDAGKLALDDPLSKHLSWFRMRPHEEGREPTIRSVLTHSSGLPRESDYPYWTDPFDFPTREKVIERLQAQEPLYPSERFLQYSNLGITLAGEIISAVSGVPYDEYVRRNILAPVGLTSTFTEIPLAERGKRLAAGYSAKRRDGSRAALPPFQVRGIAPAAGFASTANDLARFAAWNFRVLQGEQGVIDPRTLREMQRAHWVEPDLDSFWGLGYSVWKDDGKVFVGHGGACPGFRTSLTLDTARRIGVVVLANANGIQPARYAKALYDIIAPALESGAQPDAGTAASLAPYVGSYDSFPWSGETIVAAWGDELLFIGLPTMDPMKEPAKFRRTGEHRFRRVRKDGSLGETVVFDIGPDGRAIRYWQHSNPYPRMANGN
ncbi:MAG TPA: serine hydrolase domain-containing protein [Thermoanaerobaculia bacterium]|nr:serine hydrolase domain-containing protein [Thermoanaerobaculia bacterium]